jgi:hypothetical protein
MGRCRELHPRSESHTRCRLMSLRVTSIRCARGVGIRGARFYDGHIPQMRVVLACAASFLMLTGLVAPHEAMASETATTSVNVTANFTSRTSLRVSSQQLHFEIGDPNDDAVAVVEFTAAARTREGGEVVLTVEPMRSVEGPGGAGDLETTIAFDGDGEGTTTGVLRPTSVSVAGRWIGSGVRRGRLRFSLRAPVGGTYTMPVRFVLSTP